MKYKATLVALACVTFGAGCGEDTLVNDGLAGPGSAASAFRAEPGPRQNIVVAATGLETQPGQLTFQVPAASAAEIVSARLYWAGRGAVPTGDDRILVQGSWRVGTLLASYEVGGELPWVFFYEYDAVGLIRHGYNNLYISDFQLGSPSRPDGVAAVVIFNDPASPWTAIHTVMPHEFVSDGPGNVIDLPIGGCVDARNARLLVIAGDCTAAAADRIWWSAGPGTSPPDLVGSAFGVFDDRLGATRGNWMDVLDEPLTVPAHATHFAYEVESPAASGDDIVHVFGAICIDGEATSCAGTIAGTVWQDDDRDGARGGTEPGLPGVPVMLHDAAGSPVTDAVTDAAGEFAFPLICAGDYSVEVDETALPEDFESTSCANGACNPRFVTLAADDASIVADFGWAPALPPPPATTRCFLGLDFWRRQFDRPSRCPARRRLDPARLAAIVEDVAATTGMDWTRGDGVLSVEDVRRALRRGPHSHCHGTPRSYLVSLLNWALNGADPEMPVDTTKDGEADMTFRAYITEVEGLLLGHGRRDQRRARRMVTSVNSMPDEGCDLVFPDDPGIAGIFPPDDER